MVKGTRELNTGRIRLGMVGGGQGAFIGAVHRLAARMDDHYDFVAGALSADAKKAKASGEELGLAGDRIYPDFKSMAKAEAALPADQRIDFVSIVTRNNTHAAVAKTFVELDDTARAEVGEFLQEIEDWARYVKVAKIEVKG